MISPPLPPPEGEAKASPWRCFVFCYMILIARRLVQLVERQSPKLEVGSSSLSSPANSPYWPIINCSPRFWLMRAIFIGNEGFRPDFGIFGWMWVVWCFRTPSIWPLSMGRIDFNWKDGYKVIFCSKIKSSREETASTMYYKVLTNKNSPTVMMGPILLGLRLFVFTKHLLE